MLGTIIKREIQEYLRSTKFSIGILITIILITISTIININDLQQRNQDYLDAKKEMSERGFRVTVYRAPNVLSTLVQGKDRKLGNRLDFNYLNIPSRTSGYMGQHTSQHYRYLAGFAAVDFAFVVRVILSLMVIFLSYNVISEEKTRGTLKLMLANRLPRDQLLLGKFLGGLFVIIGSLLIASLISALIMLFHPAIFLNSGEWINVIYMFGISVLYLICFYTISLFISVIVNRPSIAMMILLQIWIFLIIIYPNLGVILAEQFYKLPSEQEIASQKEASFQSYKKEFEQNRKAFHDAIVSGGSPSKEITLKNVELSAIKTELAYQIDKDFSSKLTKQVQLAQTISILSPAILYDQAMERYAGTGINDFELFMEGVFQYWKKYIERYKLRYIDREAYRNSEFPDFEWPSETVTRRFMATLPQLLILFLLSTIFFVLAYTTFLRKDVR